MALKTLYLYPTTVLDAFGSISNPEAAMVDDGDETFAEVGNHGWLEFGGVTNNLPPSTPIVEVALEARLEVGEGGGASITVAGATRLPFRGLDVPTTEAIPLQTMRVSANILLDAFADRVFGPITAEHLDGLQRITVAAGFAAVKVYFVRLAVTYDDGEPEPGPGPEPKPEEPEVPPLLIPRTVEAKLDPVGDGSALEPQAQTDLIPSTGEAELFRYQDPNPNQDTFLIPLGVGGKIV